MNKMNILRLLYMLLLLTGPVLLITCSVLLALDSGVTVFNVILLMLCFLASVWYFFKVAPSFKQLYVDIRRARKIKKAQNR